MVRLFDENVLSLMAKSTPETLVRKGSGLEPSALFRSDSLDRFESPKKEVIGGSNLNPFKVDMQPFSSPSLAGHVSIAHFASSGHENIQRKKDTCGISDEDTIITAVDEADDDSIDKSPVPSSPFPVLKVSTTARKRSVACTKEIMRNIDEGCINPCTNSSTHYRSIPSPLHSPPLKRKDYVLTAPFKGFRQGEIESALSFESNDSSNSCKSMNSSLSPPAQCNFHIGIGSDKGFTASTGLFSFTRSPIQEKPHLENGSPYREDDDVSTICATKIRRLNLDYNMNDCQFKGTESAITLQKNREPIEVNRLDKNRNIHVDIFSPKNVASFADIDNDLPPPPSSAFVSPPLPKRKGGDGLTYTHSPHQGMHSWGQETPRATPMLKRKACRSPFLSHNDETEKPIREETSRLMQDFETIGTLGDGSFGTVYKCISRLDGCPYAVKATKYQAKGKADRDRMLKEVYALAALSELTDTAVFHIVGYHQAWMEENRLYIQTELCTSTLLEEIKNEDAIVYDTSRQFKVLREMLLALDLIHRNGMVHLDIKPENIFVKNNQFKLGDFGLATKSSVRGDVEEGDCRYMCNDLLQGNHGDLTKCDIFSLGATMYEIALRRTLPTHGEEWHQIRACILCPLPHTSNELCDIIKVMIHPNREQRSSAAMLLKRRQLLSEDQKQLVLARNKVREANMALAVQDARLKALKLPPKKTLIRANTLG